MSEIYYKINFGISIFLCANSVFNEMLNNNSYSIINITLDDEIFDGCRDSYGLEFKEKMYDIMKIIFINNRIKIFDNTNKHNIEFTRRLFFPFDSYKYEINNNLVNIAFSKKNIKVPDKFITITTKIMECNTSINLNNTNKKILLDTLNTLNLPIIIIGEKSIEKCKEYDILKPYSIYNDFITNLNNYLDYTIESSKDNNNTQELYNTIYILNNSKLNLYLTSSGAPTIGLSCSNNILGVCGYHIFDKSIYLHKDNSNINFVSNLEDFFKILNYKIDDLNKQIKIEENNYMESFESSKLQSLDFQDKPSRDPLNITIFKNNNFTELFQKDNTERNIGYSLFNNVILTGRNTYYPNVLLYENKNTNNTNNTNNLISPYDEKVMSLNKDSFYDNNTFDISIDNNLFDISTINNINKNIIEAPIFFFIYNFDNYYHFLYDTIPYLFTYLELKKTIPELKILVNYPNKNMTKFYKFNEEFLEKIINIEDLIIHSDNNIYKNMYVSSSLTHGGFSNNCPRPEIFEIYKIIKNNINFNKINKKYKNVDKPLDKIYISRRTWINNDSSNIGTDYTSRRKMMNEDTLVENLVTNYDFTEIFSENLNTDEKIYLFSNAKIIIGSIGGGMSNLLFSNNMVRSIVLVTPYFLDINYRFRYSMEHTNVIYFNDITTYLEDNKIPLYCRVIITNKESKYFNKCGEISEYNNDFNKYLVNISNNDVAGFNNLILFENELFKEDEFKLLDKGLNSPYIVNLESLFVLL